MNTYYNSCYEYNTYEFTLQVLQLVTMCNNTIINTFVDIGVVMGYCYRI